MRSRHHSALSVGCIFCLWSILLSPPSAVAEGIEAGSGFDAAPFALPLDGDDPSPGLRWGEPRKIRRVVIEFSDKEPAPAPEKVQVQYWKGSWNGHADAVVTETSAGGQGWEAVDDWTNGGWQRAEGEFKVDGRVWTFTFAPTSDKEFKEFGGEGVTYRKTLKLRLHSDTPLPRPARLQAITDAVYKALSVRVLLGKPAEPSIRIEGADSGTLEVYNGLVTAMADRTLQPSSRPGAWSVKNDSGELTIGLLMAVDPVDSRYDRTLVTLRSKFRPFTFAADEVARGDRILVDDLGALVVRSDDAITLDGYRQARREYPGRTVYDRVFNHPEQTLRRAWNQMPIRHPMDFTHGLPGNRNAMRVKPNGNVEITNRRHWFRRPESPKDSLRKDWTDEFLTVRFDLPDEELRGGRELLDGSLPMLRVWWTKGPLFYEQRSVLDLLRGGDVGSTDLDDPTVLLMQIRVVNTSAHTDATAHLQFSTSERDEALIIDGEQALGEKGGKRRLRFILQTGGKGDLARDGSGTRWNLPLRPGEAHTLFIAIPSITLTGEEEIEALRKRDFERDARRVCDFWRGLNDGGTVIRTPEPWLNDFHRTHLQHMVINCQKELGSDRLYPHVGTFSYGYYVNESMMMVSDLDRRGHHDLARRCLDTLLEYQGSVMLPGTFKSKDGILYGCRGHESGGYNKHHGYAMWGMAEHWKFTRDRKWMEKWSPQLVKACDWVINERKATMKVNPDGSRPFEYGWLPAGGLEDVQDYWFWLATNAATVWGFDALSAALADYGHPEAGRLVREAKAYHDDVAAGLTEARIVSAVVRLRDGTYVPKFPSRLYERGRCVGWIREVLEGSIFLPIMGLVDPNSVETRWILKDYEDNLYISNTYGYTIGDFNHFWFSRGGFCMQAQLLDSPIPYIQRDEPKHFIRTYFNAFTSAFEPPVRMCNEHSLPELGYPAGDHFKTSDEAQSTYWLRLMFVHEQGNDLILGQAIPRYWLKEGQTIGIERAATWFGPLSFSLTPDLENAAIRATVTPPDRNRPQNIYVRLRHPDSKPIQSVTVNGRPHTQFDVKKEWVVIPGNAQGPQEIVAGY